MVGIWKTSLKVIKTGLNISEEMKVKMMRREVINDWLVSWKSKESVFIIKIKLRFVKQVSNHSKSLNKIEGNYLGLKILKGVQKSVTCNRENIRRLLNDERMKMKVRMNSRENNLRSHERT